MTTYKPLRKIELLAPARNSDIAIEAIKHGADAVYIGADAFGARAAAGNSVEDIAKVVDFAHSFLAKVYVTVNTIIYNDELHRVENLIKDLYRIGVDAVIVQDMAVLRLDLPPIALHASTQCDTRTPEKARFLQDVGFSQIVLPREMSLDEIRAVHEAVDVPLESFVHGALCVCYSGDCQASYSLKGRSANRGECAQICRLPFDLYDGAGNCRRRGQHLLSLRDLNLSDRIESMLDAGVSSFKIEGRLKDASYVKNVVAHYHRKLNEVIASSGGKYVRSSVGEVRHSFAPQLDKSFNRGFTRYFIDGADSRLSIASIYTPKSQGERVGVVKAVKPGCLIASLDCVLSNGDGLGYFDSRNCFVGFRINRAEGDRLFPASKVDVAPGTVLYRNSDKAFDDMLSRDSATRSIGVTMALNRSSRGIVLKVDDERGNGVAVTLDMDEMQPANTPQDAARRNALGKLGGTIYVLKELDDSLGNLFVPVSKLAELRRRAVSMLDSANRIRYVADRRRDEIPDAKFPGNGVLSYHDNVANDKARDFYEQHGAKLGEQALEVGKSKPGHRVVMTTRYCLRRELGCCLRDNGEARMPSPLTLRNGGSCLELEFDCRQCIMRVINVGVNKKFS